MKRTQARIKFLRKGPVFTGIQVPLLFFCIDVFGMHNLDLIDEKRNGPHGFASRPFLFGVLPGLTFKCKRHRKYFRWHADGQNGDFQEFACGFGLFS
jgi:hypothetical protein